MGSTGSNRIGNQTGKTTDTSNAGEALELLHMIESVDWESKFTQATMARDFITDMSAKAKQYGPRLQVTGRQLFYLRNLKDQLVEAGVL